MYRLSLSGWTQEEIGNLYDMTKQAVGQRVKQIKLLKDTLLSDFYDKGELIAKSLMLPFSEDLSCWTN